MLKGHVFSKQLFENPIFALFINTFLNGVNGVSNNYKNGMEVSYSDSTVTIDSGAVCIQGRFLEEDLSTTLSAGTNNAYCKLVIEIDLDKQNTVSEFNQASYKIITSSSAYPNLTQTNIVKNVSGVYQYELARFRTNSSGIFDFQDMRTFLDFNSIYTQIQNAYEAVLDELQQELENVKDGSDYLLKSAGGTVEGLITANGGIKGSLTGNADSATELQNARNIVLTGAVNGSTSFNGTQDASIVTRLVSKTLTTEDLNMIKADGLYHAAGENTVKNKPAGIDNFGLIVKRTGNTAYQQILYSGDVEYIRYTIDANWSSWQKNVTYGNFAVITGTISAAAGGTLGSPSYNSKNISFPTGYNSDNCMAISWCIKEQSSDRKAFGCTTTTDPRTWLRGGYASMVSFYDNETIGFSLEYPKSEATTIEYKIILMKI